MLSEKSKLLVLIVSVLFLMIPKYVIDHNAQALPPILQLFAHASLPIAGGLIMISFCSLLGALSDVEDSTASHLLRRISDSPTRNFLIGFLTTAYLDIIRPPLAFNLQFLPYIEWITVALTVYVMYTTTNHSTKGFYVNSETPSWKKHIQEVTREAGHDLTRITSIIEQFVNHGVKEPLLVCLTLHLQRLGQTEEAVLKILSPLINHRENARRRKLDFFAFPWTKRKIAMRNKKAREDLLKTLVRKIDRLRSE